MGHRSENPVNTQRNVIPPWLIEGLQAALHG